ncbi:hypothetical protein L596_017772 [Steinernema carpocapsae]|uniref:Uncharacterized protein n=1 Tax=Steinernema carpocapsae TaxID=34508 RepID=A0A4U5N3C7_STECR|nr:hypothetical protein L596_017772 [Steinernema carpocapsae]
MAGVTVHAGVAVAAVTSVAAAAVAASAFTSAVCLASVMCAAGARDRRRTESHELLRCLHARQSLGWVGERGFESAPAGVPLAFRSERLAGQSAQPVERVRGLLEAHHCALPGTTFILVFELVDGCLSDVKELRVDCVLFFDGNGPNIGWLGKQSFDRLNVDRDVTVLVDRTAVLLDGTVCVARILDLLSWLA